MKPHDVSGMIIFGSMIDQALFWVYRWALKSCYELPCRICSVVVDWNHQSRQIVSLHDLMLHLRSHASQASIFLDV